MNIRETNELKKKIDWAQLISFDVFDTLVFRKTNEPETVFELIGRHFGIHGFRTMRINAQNEASKRAYALDQSPHANFDQIYEVLSERTDIPVDWDEVKNYEIEIETDALVVNPEMLEIYKYAKSKGKRVVATTDMYLWADTIGTILYDLGYDGLDHIYCSADERAAKFNKNLFEVVANKEGLEFRAILHIGDKERDDIDYPSEYGIQTFLYKKDLNLKKLEKAYSSGIDKGIYKILADDKKDFWYNLGVEVGGPLYTGLLLWLLPKLEKTKKKLFLLSRDGYNLYNILKHLGYDNIEYMYTSRRAMTLASVSTMDERDISVLPPYTFGQTVGEILDYLCIDRNMIKNLKEVGFSSFEDAINDEEDMENFKKLYLLDRGVFLKRAEIERKNALEYLDKIGFLDGDNLCFDCGWQGSSQELLESFKDIAGIDDQTYFYYFGIKNSEKSIKQLHGKHYEAFLFDFYMNYFIQYDVDHNVALYELFFTSPETAVYYYDENGKIVFEKSDQDRIAYENIYLGILDFVKSALGFSQKYKVEYDPEAASGHLKRLIHDPVEREASIIGNIGNIDSFANSKDKIKYLGYVSDDRLNDIANMEIYWPEGVLARSDVSDAVKKAVADRFCIDLEKETRQYNLEDESSLNNYRMWLNYHKNDEKVIADSGVFFSVVIPVYNTKCDQLKECIESVLAQNYDRYELILVDDCSTMPEVSSVLRSYEGIEHVQVVYRKENGNISVATNDGISRAKGEFIVFMDCDDLIESDALSCFAKLLEEKPELDFIYSDEDKITEDGKIRHFPSFKPDWSPDLFLNMMYTNHLAAYRTELVKKVGGLRTEYNGAQDYDLTLRIMEQIDDKCVGHIHRVLYHWRERRESVAFAIGSKRYAVNAAREAKEDYIRRNNIDAFIEPIVGVAYERLVYRIAGSPKVSIIIPSKDNYDVLKACISSVSNYTEYQNYEIIVVDNGSSEKNKESISEYLNSIHAKYLYDRYDFNFSKMCNLGARHADGEYLLFLNDDVELFQSQWLSRMLGQAQQDRTGAVGAKLFYPESTIIQHSGVYNYCYGPSVAYGFMNDMQVQMNARNWVDVDYIAVTAACLMVNKKKFFEIGGFNEEYPIAYNDVELCYRLHNAGYFNVQRNDAVAWHHESLSRGEDNIDSEKLARLGRELARLRIDYPEYECRDPFINNNIGCLSTGLVLKNQTMKMNKIDLSEYIPIGQPIYIDSFICENSSVIVNGWINIENIDFTKDLCRYLICADSFGNQYTYETIRTYRSDVSAFCNNENMGYSAFSCRINRSELRFDLMQYRMGIAIHTEDDRKLIAWGRNSDLISNDQMIKPLPDYIRINNCVLHEHRASVEWNIDSFEYFEKECRYNIVGYAFVKGNKKLEYRTIIMLIGKSGDSVEIEVEIQDRIDVGMHYVDEHYASGSGFMCNIFADLLSQSSEYNVYIRLRNNCNEDDVQDIATGKVCCVG